MKFSYAKIVFAALWLANLNGPMAQINSSDSTGQKLMSFAISIGLGLLAVINIVEAVEYRAKERAEAAKE